MNKSVAILMVLIPLACFVQQIQARNRHPPVITTTSFMLLAV